MNHHLNHLLSTTFQGVGEPTSISRSRMAEMQSNLERIRDPNAFAVTLDLRSQPSITWTHNTDLHFGFERLAVQDYLRLIHPQWVEIYFAYAAAAYRLGRKHHAVLKDKNVSITSQVPLRHIDGRYYWYNQTSYPCAYDSAGNMVAHLNQFHRVAEFGRLRPGHPIVTIADRRQPDAEDLLRRQSQEVLVRLFLNDLTKRERGVLRCFQALHARKGREVSNQEVGKVLQLAHGTINKNNTRILTKAKEVFPTNAFSTLSELAGFLNLLFGNPLTRA